jgi:uncharacterized protein (TIGR02246 family)
MKKRNFILTTIFAVFSFTSIYAATDTSQQQIQYTPTNNTVQQQLGDAKDNIHQQQLRQAYDQWVTEMTTAKGHPENVLALYAPDAILLATFEPMPLISRQAMEPYFKNLTSLKDLNIKTSKFYTQIYHNIGINSGIYVFSYTDAANKPVQSTARFTFVYHKSNGKWLIVNHHSSELPKSLH